MKSNNIERLSKVVGFDATKRERGSQEALANVLKKVNDERRVKAEAEAEGLIRQALELTETQVKLEREFNGAMQKHDKALGKLMGRLEAYAAGRDAPAEQPEGGEKASETPPEQ